MTLHHTGWQNWSDPIQVVMSGNPATGTYTYPTDFTYADDAGSLGLFAETDADSASVRFSQTFAGPDPDDDPLCGFVAARLGYSGNSVWGGFCPTPSSYGTFAPGGAPIDLHATGWTNSYGGLGLHAANSGADIGGWVYRPWNVPSYTDQWMGRGSFGPLLDTWAAYETAHHPSGDGWYVEWEQFFPTFLGLEFAPDESTTLGTHDGRIYWLTDPALGWGYVYDGGSFVFQGPGGIDATPITFASGLTDYGGELVGFTPVPTDWLPTWDPTTGEFVTPTDEDAAAIPVTLAHQGIVDNLATAGGSGQRDYQTIAFRATWQPPRFRWSRETPNVPAPRRVIGRQGDGLVGGGRRVIGGRSTRQNGNRTIGRTI